MVVKLGYLWSEVQLGLRRGGWMNWAAISTVTVLLFLFGLSWQVAWQLEGLANQFGSQLEVSVYLDAGWSAKPLVAQVADLPGVVQVEDIAKEEAWMDLLTELGLNSPDAATEILPTNPLVDELRVKAESPEALRGLVPQLEQLSGVDEVIYGEAALEMLSTINRGLRILSLGVTMVLMVSAIAVMTTTIELIVVSRRREIEIMHLVGASHWWIRLPFMIQGVILGSVGGAIAWSIVQGFEQVSLKFLTQELSLIPLLSHLQDSYWTIYTDTTTLFFLLLVFGALVGGLGGWLGLRRVSALRTGNG
ncbi:cell division protein FtsX [Roseofilum capinflatum]|uniref:Cell division protein FtsX n=1 Tax=Roseofilum capinflatum BLCC-M114 TaxID=3022440 RepID=A0ABT7BCK0_9CYAN|nr:ABC transporter permease [Roseofilum capinflatum]MDJ1176497.1 ABC transporter permease [Roseofilum capinflatum BLCC-M114]